MVRAPAARGGTCVVGPGKHFLSNLMSTVPECERHKFAVCNLRIVVNRLITHDRSDMSTLAAVRVLLYFNTPLRFPIFRDLPKGFSVKNFRGGFQS